MAPGRRAPLTLDTRPRPSHSLSTSLLPQPRDPDWAIYSQVSVPLVFMDPLRPLMG